MADTGDSATRKPGAMTRNTMFTRVGVDGQARSSGRPLAKTSEVVARHLADQIIDQQLPPGTRLPAEKEMIEAFDVGRSTLREALRLLETRGVLTIKRGPGGGPVVRRPRPEDLGDALSLILQFEGASLREVIDARQALEPTIARLAAERISDAEVDSLQATIDTMRARAGDHAVFLDQNWIFHSTISEAAHSIPLRAFVDSLKSIWDGAFVGVRYSARRHHGVADAHQKIVDVLRQHDPEAATQAMNDHLREASRYWSKKYGGLMDQKARWMR
jgi:GntR family transcriptional repressor for pyruvate dehydrogenase complex